MCHTCLLGSCSKPSHRVLKWCVQLGMRHSVCLCDMLECSEQNRQLTGSAVGVDWGAEGSEGVCTAQFSQTNDIAKRQECKSQPSSRSVASQVL